MIHYITTTSIDQSWVTSKRSWIIPQPWTTSTGEWVSYSISLTDKIFMDIEALILSNILRSGFIYTGTSGYAYSPASITWTYDTTSPATVTLGWNEC